MADEKKPVPEEKEPEEAAGEERQPEKRKPRVPMAAVVAVLVLVGIAAAASIAYFVASRLVTSSQTDEGGSRYHDPGVFVKLGDAKEGILVNVGGIKGGHFLKIGIIVEMNPGKKDNIVEGKLNPVAETKLMDITLHILRAEPLDGYDAAKQDALKAKIKAAINHELGEGSVYDVYFTSFVLQ